MAGIMAVDMAEKMAGDMAVDMAGKMAGDMAGDKKDIYNGLVGFILAKSLISINVLNQ